MKTIILLIYIFLNICQTNSSSNSFCGAKYLNLENVFPKKAPELKNSEKPINKGEFFPIRIFVDHSFMDEQINGELKELSPYYDKILNAMNRAIDGLKKLIKVEQYDENFLDGLNSQLIIENKIYKWKDELNNIKEVAKNYDYVLFLRFLNETETPPGITVQASGNPILLAQNTNRPIAGVLRTIKDKSFYSQDNFDDYFSKVYFHELIHALGFLEPAWGLMPGGTEKNLLVETDEHGIERYYLKSPKLMEFAKKYYGCNDFKGIELENQGGDGEKKSHWEARTMSGEIMTSDFYEGEVTLSELTLAVLEDTGWYEANYYTGGLFRFGKNKGCDFLKTYCIDSGKTKFEDEYFSLDEQSYPTCTTGRQSMAYKTVYNYWDTDFFNPFYTEVYPKQSYPPERFIVTAGSLVKADYCPIANHIETEKNNSYFVGNCKTGNGQYGKNIYYYNPETQQREGGHPNSELVGFGEKYSNNSFCMMSKLVPEGKPEMYGTIFHPMCFQSFCSDESLTVLINDQYVVCPREGGNIEVKGYQGKFHCPDYNLICTGTVMCNDILDCIEHESKYKENTFTYDYVPNATQGYRRIVRGETFIGWERSQNGKCPINCVSCSIDGKCNSCRDGYLLIGEYENDTKAIIKCDNMIDVEYGYYLKGDVYYKCHENCKTCKKGPEENKMNCERCKTGLVLNETNLNCEINNKTDNDTSTIDPSTEDTSTDDTSKEDTSTEETSTHDSTTPDSSTIKTGDGGVEVEDDNRLTIVIIVFSVVVIILVFVIVYIGIKSRRIKLADVDIPTHQELIEDINN